MFSDDYTGKKWLSLRAMSMMSCPNKGQTRMNNIYIPYLIVEAYCFIYGAAVLFRLNSNIASQHQIRELRNVLLAYFGMIIFDIVAICLEQFAPGVPRWILAIFNGFAVIFVTLGCYFWFRFIAARFYPNRNFSWKWRILISIPMFLMVLGDFISMGTGWLFFITDAGEYAVTDFFWFQAAVNYSYLLVPTVISFYRYFKDRSASERKEYLVYALYMVAPLTAGLLEDVFPTTPILTLNIFLVIHILFLMIQDKQIYNDALTNLNNRRHLNQFLEEHLSKASPERPVTVFMIDINGFKSINDRFGHVEGDNALRFFADIMREVAGKYDAFIARYGGDEFSMVLDSASVKPEDVENFLVAEVAEKQKTASTLCHQYVMSLSIGYYTCTDDSLSPDAAFARADEGLYRQKKMWHQKNDIL